ncbi:hypothetical protein [Gloeobacter kilaueensis]|uniref:Uncharacterized protein n=1 Tax=Gloeobacter kilaueensis (strain ATCC BAA-2537 / CCAP 1431/1 / ULC 316 / JS1) TaxID=1183438 RepID=U5QJ36_GLOK1|nr:hypothetical protein [Gloeobacter kilaueensis]AGY58868.1 hypothetical protein GKIL_2622 [Gloeobacter kilaueensis JS1]
MNEQQIQPIVLTDEKQIQLITPNDLAVETSVFVSYLEHLNLPTDNIIAPNNERKIVASNLPDFLFSLPQESKRDARYLSKFVGATAIGLFDAALNYVWNEVVVNLRKKASIYGIDLFFDAAIGGKNRDEYKDENDLGGLKDIVLLNTCLKLELVSGTVHRKLDYILTMRNEVAASHPNVESIGGFELLGWLQTCITEVLQDPLSESAIKIKLLVDNLKSMSDVIDDVTLARVAEQLRHLSLPHIHNLLVTIFGMFVSPSSEQVLRRNISKIAPFVWNHATPQVKYNIGSKIDGYRTNLNNEKLERGVEFLTIVGGHMYESIPAKTIALEHLADQLEEKHEGRDNFYNEPAVMKEILKYCKSSTDIPTEVLPKLVRIVLRCRLGRGLSYQSGVSPGGLPLYDQFLKLLDDNGVAFCIAALFSPEISSKLENSICQKHLKAVLENLRSIVISERLRDSIDFLLKDVPKAYLAKNVKEFRELTANYIQWR